MRLRQFDFSEYSAESLFNAMNDQRTAIGTSVPCSISLGSLPPDSVSIAFHPGQEIAVRASSNLASLPVSLRNLYANRWLAALVIFVRTFERYPDLEGGCQLWLGDMPNYPGLAFCGNSVGQVCIPDPAFLCGDGYVDARNLIRDHGRPWKTRENKVLWRGSSTGVRPNYREATWRDLPRMRLCLKVKDYMRPDVFDVALSKIAQIDRHDELEEIAAHNLVRDEVFIGRFSEYRYGIDIDGNTNSWPGLFCKLIFGNTILKIDSEHGFRQWYYDRLRPWKNFVPVSAGMSELLDVTLWLMNHPDRAESIAQGASELGDSLSFPAVVEEAADVVAGYLRSGAGVVYQQFPEDPPIRAISVETSDGPLKGMSLPVAAISAEAARHAEQGLVGIEDGTRQEQTDRSPEADALEVAEAAVAAEPADYRRLVHLAFLLIGRDETDRAEVLLGQAEHLAPESAGVVWAFSHLRLRQGRLAEALGAAERAASLRPADFHMQAHYANLLAAVGLLDQAEVAFARALAIDDRQARVHFAYSNVFLQQGRLAEATSAAERARELDPEVTTYAAHLDALRERLRAAPEASRDPIATDDPVSAASSDDLRSAVDVTAQAEGQQTKPAGTPSDIRADPTAGAAPDAQAGQPS